MASLGPSAAWTALVGHGGRCFDVGEDVCAVQQAGQSHPLPPLGEAEGERDAHRQLEEDLAADDPPEPQRIAPDEEVAFVRHPPRDRLREPGTLIGGEH